METDSPAVVAAIVQQHVQALGMAPAEAAPYLLPLLGVPDSAPPLVSRNPQEIRAQTFATLHQLLRHESQRQPLLVVVENLHWIDPTSQEYLAEVVEQLPSMPLLLLVTFRPGYRPPWMEKSYATQLALTRLSPADSRRVVQGVLHLATVPEPLLQDILAQAAGNPLFLEELAWTVREHGDQRLPPDVPAAIHAVLTARIDRLSPAAKQVLQTAAVIGPEVRLSLLQTLTALPEEALWHSLQHLHTAEFLYEMRPAPEQTYAFKHALTQEAAYQSLLKRTRQQVHQQIAQVLEAQFPVTAETHPEVLARHYTEAGLAEEAVGYWQRAGERSHVQSAYVEAVVHCTKGLDILRTLPDTPARAQHELDMQIALGRALTVTKGFAALETGQAFARARELCHQVGDMARLFAVLEGLHDFYPNRGDLQTVRDLDKEYLTLAQCQHDPERLAWIHLEMGVHLYFLGELVPARAHFEQAVSLCTSLQPHSLTLHEHSGVPCLAYTAFTLWMLGYPDQALARCHDMLSLAQALSHPYRLARALQYAASLHGLRREGATAQA